jgi:predicted component of type VI protein secretion system
MFLSPQQLQAADRHTFRRLREMEEWYNPFAWGLKSIELDSAALTKSLPLLGRWD